MSDSERRTESYDQTVDLQGTRGDRRSVWDVLPGFGVSGALFGASGGARTQFLLGFAAVALLVVAVSIANILTLLHDRPELGVAAPIIWEVSSGITMLLFLWIPWLACRLAPPVARPMWRTASVHLSAAALFSFAHVAGFVLIRQAVYLAAGDTYSSAPLTQDFLYEFRKDALSYIIIVAIFWAVGVYMSARLATIQPKSVDGPAYVDIRDGARLDRVHVSEILAVRSADNYVEFVLTDGRRLMTRKSLSAVEGELDSNGFLRTHRSWLVNTARMTALKPEGSGDYTVELGNLSVPVSRRFPDALSKLRAGPSNGA